MPFPKDVYMLLSVINMRLRDSGASFEELCADEGEDCAEIEAKLAKIGYFYCKESNAFVAK